MDGLTMKKGARAHMTGGTMTNEEDCFISARDYPKMETGFIDLSNRK